MKEVIESVCYVLGDDIDTDQIIPARHLAISLDDPRERARYGGLALSGVPRSSAGKFPFADPQTNRTEYKILIAGKNFGCGSSREHAPVALAEAGVELIIAQSYARIFFRNAVDGGYFPPYECEVDLKNILRTGDPVRFDKAQRRLTALATGDHFEVRSLGAAGPILESGGIFGYARKFKLTRNVNQAKTETS